MKKIILSFLVALCLLISPFALSEESIDDMTLEELIDLELKVQEKIYELDKTANCVVYQGVYEIGRDLEPGTYIFQCVEVYSQADVAAVVSYSGEERISHNLLADGESCQIAVEEGMKLGIGNGVFTFLKR